MVLINNKNALLVIAVGVVMLLTFIRDMFGVTINQYAILAVVSFFLILLNKQQCINYTFFLLALLSGIQGLSVTVASLVLLGKTQKMNPVSWVFIIVIIFLEVINSSMFGPNDADFTKLIILYSSNIFLFFYLLYFNNKDLDVAEAIKFFLIGASFVMMVILIRSMMAGGILGLALEATRIGNRDLFDETNILSTEYQMNPNSLAFYSLITITVLFSFNKQLRIKPLLFYFLIFISVLAGIFSFSRTWILCVIVYFIIYFIGNRGNWKNILLTVAVLLFVFFAFDNFMDLISDGFFGRFNEDNLTEAGGRTVLFRDYNRWMVEHNRTFFGIGILYYVDITHIAKGSHSGLQQIFIAYGYTGLILFLIAALVYKFQFVRKLRLITLLPFIICLIYDQSIQFLSNPILLFPFLMLAYTLRLETTKDRIQIAKRT